MYTVYSEEYLAHHGVLGMKWGVRRYQNEDGSLTPAGKSHYGISDGKKADGYNLSAKLSRDVREASEERYSKANKTRKESLAKAKYEYKSKNISDPSNKKTNKLDYKEEKRKIKEKHKEDLKKAEEASRKDVDEAIRIWKDNTSKGANITKAVLSGVGAVALAGIAGNAGANGNSTIQLGAALAAGALAGVSDTYISNLMAASRLERTGTVYKKK